MERTIPRRAVLDTALQMDQHRSLTSAARSCSNTLRQNNMSSNTIPSPALSSNISRVKSFLFRCSSVGRTPE